MAPQTPTEMSQSGKNRRDMMPAGIMGGRVNLRHNKYLIGEWGWKLDHSFT
jgi:hypothetical protein